MTTGLISGSILAWAAPSLGATPTAPDTPAAAAPILAPVGPASDIPPAEQRFPGSTSEVSQPVPAQIVSGDTPGDEILTGLNKCWGKLSNALAQKPEALIGRREADPEGKARRVASGENGRKWQAVGDGYQGQDDDARKLDAAERWVEDLNEGQDCALELSKTIHSSVSSLKSLLTGQ